MGLELRCDRDEELPIGPVAVTGVALAGPSRIVVPCGGMRSTPALALSVATAGAEASGPIDFPARASTTTDGRSLLAPILLGAALLMLLVVAATRLREPAAAASPAAAQPTADADAPRLALVPIPHEHGP